jgi:hypothetical protein
MINGKISLNVLLSALDSSFDQIIIPIPPGADMLNRFETALDNKYLEKVQLVASVPGQGDGGAILDGMEYLQTKEKHFFVCWGDTFIINKTIFSDLLKFALSDSLMSYAYIPLVYLDNPYVSYTLDNEKFILDAQQSIDGHTFQAGFADQSIFMLSKDIKKFLQTSSLNITSSVKGASEISLLRSFKTLVSKNLKLKPMIRESKDSLAFNTKEDLATIIKL